jgi:predicted metal-dependent phosphotriesterase family hydrolase
MKIMENWHPDIFLNILPTLRESGISENQLDKMLSTNAEALFAGAAAKVI